MKKNFTFLIVLLIAITLSSCGGSSSSSSPAESVLLGGAVQGKSVSLSGLVSSLSVSTSAPGYNGLGGITTDGTNLFVADTGNNIIYKVVISTGAVTTIAGTAGIQGPADGTGATASFYTPNGITTDGVNLFVCDENNQTIRKIVIMTGEVTTIAGTAGVQGSVDGVGVAARFFAPTGITTDGTNLFITDQGNSTIRKMVISTGAVTTIAGTAGVYGSADGTGAAASFKFPVGITTDGTNLFISDQGNSTIRKMVISTGKVTTIAGTAGVNGSADGTGAAASFYAPYGVTTDGANLFVCDESNNTIRKLVISTGKVTTIAGTAGVNGASDGTATSARFYEPAGITTDGTSLFVADSYYRLIRKIQ